MSDILTYDLAEGIATLTMDDGKVNCFSPTMLAELNGALDQAEAEHAVVLLAGREGLFSGGFDLSEFKRGPTAAYEMLKSGAELALRILSFPRPVVVACTGHCIAMGAFVALSADQRIGAAGRFKTVLNEVSIGMTVPEFGVEIARQRLTPSHFSRALITSEPFLPEQAVEAGFLDRVVPAEDLLKEAHNVATVATKLDAKAHHATKLRARGHAIEALSTAIDNELGTEDKFMKTLATGMPGS